ncbi:Platelet glycoprotein V like protein [Argiope bruennichi]|uniref:Platelet glycoprotein V like protein n=1 Tax=Argiope bruennichi TaxID=94029 RepID=A0A8T0EM43_ARGBR|nr:Platelet glycoprotein V like protein [Argiope bruennichi]
MRASFPLVVFLSLFASVFSVDLCPPPALIEPCDCISGYKPITYKCSKILDQDTIEGVFSKSLDWPLNALIFDHSSLLYVSTPLINSKNVATVAIYHSRFTSLFTSPPDETNVIENIILRNTTFLRGLDWRLFKNLSPTIVQIQEVILKRIGNPFVENVKPSVAQLTMDKAKITTLHDQAFAKLTSLRSLSCAYNLIKSIKRSMFPQNTALYLIDFSKNKIDNLPDDIFSNMPHLTDVYLKDNKIKTFSSPVWEGVFDHLQAVYLDGRLQRESGRDEPDRHRC